MAGIGKKASASAAVALAGLVGGLLLLVDSDQPRPMGPVPEGRNLIANPSFENGVDSWAGYGATLASRPDPLASDGVAAELRYSASTPDAGYSIADEPSSVRGASRQGYEYVARALVRGDPANEGDEVTIRISERVGQSAELAAESTASTKLSAKEYGPVEVSHTAVGGGNSIDVSIFVAGEERQDPSTAESLHIDSVTLAHRTGGCDLYAAPDGSRGDGSREEPYGGAERLIEELDAGAGDPRVTGCLLTGTYGARDRPLVIEKPDVTLKAAPGARAAIIGQVDVRRGADRVTVEGLVLDGFNSLGPGGEAAQSVAVGGDDVAIRGNEISNRGPAAGGTVAGGICVHPAPTGNTGAPPVRTVIEFNRIHRCGRLPRSNADHGIYLRGRDAVVRSNWIYDNADRGVQIYPDADRNRITDNLIVGNGSGVIVSGDRSGASDGNLVAGNVIAGSLARYNVEFDWPGPIGERNRVVGNCVGTAAEGGEDGGLEPAGDPPGLEYGMNFRTPGLLLFAEGEEPTVPDLGPCRKAGSWDGRFDGYAGPPVTP